MKKNIGIPIYRGFIVKHLGPTNFLGERIKIIDDRFNQSVTIGYKYDAGNSMGQAMSYLKESGFSVVAVVYMNKNNIVLCDTDFTELKDGNK